jgi:hypothetical protein
MSEIGVAVQTRFPADEFDKLEDWRRAQPKIPSRPDAVRTLIRLGLNNSTDVPAGKRPSTKERAA